MVIYIITFVIELYKYCLSYKLFFYGEIKYKWTAFIGLAIFFIVYQYAALSNVEAHLVMFLIILVLLYIMISDKIITKTLNIIMLMSVLLSLDELLGIVIEKAYFNFYGNPINEAVEFLFGSILTLGFIVGANVVFKNIFLIRLDHFSKSVKQIINLCVAIMFIVIIIAITLLLYLRPYIEDENILIFMTIMSVLSYFVLCILVMFVILIKQSNEELERLARTEIDFNKMQRLFYENLLDKEVETKRFRHDIINHLICLQELTKIGDVENVRNYISKMQDQVQEIKNKYYTTGNEILDILLNYYFLTYGKNIIKNVSGKCSKPIRIDSVGMCTIFSNLIQNALEALDQETNTDKYIQINIIQGEYYVQIEIINTMTNENEKEINLSTTKKDKENHGFGLKNVIQTVNKHEGKIEFKKEPKEFIVSVVLKVINEND